MVSDLKKITDRGVAGSSSLFSLAPSPWWLMARSGHSTAAGLGHEAPVAAASLGRAAAISSLSLLGGAMQGQPILTISTVSMTDLDYHSTNLLCSISLHDFGHLLLFHLSGG
jgi:hypothetical protein